MLDFVRLVSRFSNKKGGRVGIILEGPYKIALEQSLRFTFKISNNQAEYVALIAG